MTSLSPYLTRSQSLFLKGIAIIFILSHDFFHLVPPVNYLNEMSFTPNLLNRFIADFSFPYIVNCFFSFWGYYGVYIFILLSGYGLTKSFILHSNKFKQSSNTAEICLNSKLSICLYRLIKSNFLFVAKHIFKIYKLFLICALLYCIITPHVNFSKLFEVLSLTSNFNEAKLFMVCPPWWFFSLIIQLYILFLPLYWILSKDISNLFLICFSYTLFAFYWLNFNGSEVTLYANSFGHIPEFSLGIFLAIYENKLTFLHSKFFNIFALLFSCLIVLFAQIYEVVFVFSFFFSAIIFLSTYMLFQSENKFIIFTGKISPYLFGFSAFLYRFYFIKLAREANSPLGQIIYWMAWLIVCYAFAYTAYFFANLKNPLSFLKKKNLH